MFGDGVGRSMDFPFVRPCVRASVLRYKSHVCLAKLYTNPTQKNRGLISKFLTIYTTQRVGQKLIK